MNKLLLPKIVGHRGAASYAPENTLEGIHTAADMGVSWVELDVKLTHDQVPVLFHDELLDRVSNGHGPISEILYDDLRALEVGDYFGDSAIGVPIPTLEEAIDVLLERDLGVNFEIKPCSGREKETAEVVLDVLSSVWDDHERLLLSSSSEVCLDVALDMIPTWQRGLVLRGAEWPKDIQEISDQLSLSTFIIDGNAATQDQIEELVNLGKQICAYTINDPSRAWLLQNWGVSSLITDMPDVIEDAILTVH